MYTFEKEVPIFGQYRLSDEEFEEISIHADHACVIPCLNCFAILQSKENGGILIWGMDKIEILRKVKDKSGKNYADILVTDDLESKEIRVPLNRFNANRLDSLSQYGIFCNHDDFIIEPISQYLVRIISEMPTEHAEIIVGFMKMNDDAIGFSGYEEEDQRVLSCQNSYESFEAYTDKLNELIQPSVPLQFVIAASAASLLLAYLNIYYHVPVKSFTINLIGKSTTGKSTAQELGASMMSSITDSKVISPFFGTENAVLKSLDGKYGICTHFDESTSVSAFNREVFIYSVSNEQEKKRMNSDCSIRESGTWKMIPIISSEEAFFENSSNRHQGLVIRLHTYHNLHYTVNRQHAENIHSFACQNYGLVGKKLAYYLVLEDEGEVIAYYDQCRAYMRERIGNNTCSLSERLINQYAIILLTAKLLVNFGLAIEIEQIADLMLNHHNEAARTTDIAKNAYEILMGYVSRNPYNAGIRIMEKNHEVAIAVSLFEEILRKNGYRDIKVVLDELFSKGYTKRREKKRRKVKLSLNGNGCYCYLLDTTKLEDSNSELVFDEGESYEFTLDGEACK